MSSLGLDTSSGNAEKWSDADADSGSHWNPSEGRRDELNEEKSSCLAEILQHSLIRPLCLSVNVQSEVVSDDGTEVLSSLRLYCGSSDRPSVLIMLI